MDEYNYLRGRSAIFWSLFKPSKDTETLQQSISSWEFEKPFSYLLSVELRPIDVTVHQFISIKNEADRGSCLWVFTAAKIPVGPFDVMYLYLFA